MLYHLVYLWKYVRRLQNKPTDILITTEAARREILREIRLMPQDRMLMISDPEMFTPYFTLFNVKITTPERECI